MGIGLALLITFGLIAAGCGGATQTANRTLPINDQAENDAETAPSTLPAPTVVIGPDVTIESLHIEDISAALIIITTIPDPSQAMILGFGELHDNCRSSSAGIRCLSVQTTASHFAQEIFPLLSQPEFGEIQNHVSEFFRRDPLVQSQLGSFMQGANFESLSHLSDFMSGRDFCSVLGILQMARENGTIFYGAHLSLRQLPFAQAFWQVYAGREEEVSVILGDNAYEQIHAVYDNNRSVSFYGGASHINPDPIGAFAPRSFGVRLLALAGDYYRAIALIVPEIAERDPNNPILTRLNNWQQYVPADGLTLLQTRVNDHRSLYYIIYPRTPAAQIHPIGQSEIYDCVDQPPLN
ncbi:hypothetical protein COT42_05095 [Candidatus Saganbacteria bacterium CG08_land_8_20_14_0_20_45_16]|uniref:Uncharacterized protein n=1 Tax=Candidatus Saganbacteria bacterium CG08_land_8_20_14_0_20_45_16 TaxID=2014293 RepID=A0A2H0XXP2_UNCSA|nr:MAG: hypothetical protein COT42_05095 [Candidatus Saganbacteria bacterium CG08_land_8_20_14_0_20_45_16]